jgi:hypothetical protein
MRRRLGDPPTSPFFGIKRLSSSASKMLIHFLITGVAGGMAVLACSHIGTTLA